MKYLILTSRGQVPIDEEEVEKAVKCMSERSISVFKQGIVNGAFISEIVEDVWRKQGYNYGFDALKEVRPAPYNEPLEDKFADMRKKLIGEAKNGELPKPNTIPTRIG